MSETIQTMGTSNEPQINIKKYYDGMEVIDSGAIHSFNSSDITISFNSVKVVFKFVTDETIKEKSIIDVKIDNNEKNTLIIGLINFENADLEGSPKPLNVASVGKKQIFISFFVHTIDRSKGARSFLYTVMAKE